MSNELEIILEKYFGYEDKIKYYHPADLIANDNYIRWSYAKGERTRIIISVGSNDGEVEVNIFTDPKKLEDFIKLVIYN